MLLTLASILDTTRKQVLVCYYFMDSFQIIAF